jgi:hypothetical protein
MVNMGMMWKVFRMQRRPVGRKKEVIIEWYRLHMKMVEGKNERKKDFRAPSASLHKDIN